MMDKKQNKKMKNKKKIMSWKDCSRRKKYIGHYLGAENDIQWLDMLGEARTQFYA